MKDFKAIKEEILRKAKAAEACTFEYKRAYNANDMQELCNVIKDNFWYCVNNNILTIELIESAKEYFAKNNIYANQDASSGYLLVDRGTVTALGNATVTARDNATVTASGYATVKAWDNATVTALGYATVTARDNATVTALDNATVTALNYATVTARDNAYIHCIYNKIECKLSDKAIMRHGDKIYVTMNSDIEIQK